MSFKACIEGFNYCRPLLFVDGTFLKGRYKGNILSATAKDGNQGTVFVFLKKIYSSDFVLLFSIDVAVCMSLFSMV